MQYKEKSTGRLSNSPKRYCVFEYLYRDASNYKARGKILLSGNMSQYDTVILQSWLESGEYFVAEQVGIPALYKELWELSGGPSSSDHALHEFQALRQATEDEINSLSLFGDLLNLLKAFGSITAWDYSRSPNFNAD